MQLEAHQVPPERRPDDRTLYDAWSAILKPRAPRMLGRLKRLGEPHRWIFDDETKVVDHLLPSQWSRTVREMAALYTELGGALTQYDRTVEKVEAQAEAGLRPPPTHPPSMSVLERALGILRGIEAEFIRRRGLGEIVWPDEVRYYYDLARRVNAELSLYESRLRKWEEDVARMQERADRILQGLEIKRQTLRLQMLSVRALMATLQAAEEDRLRTRTAALPETEPLRAEAEALADALRAARIDAENHEDRPATYGSILRKDWLQTRAKLERRLKRAEAAAAAGSREE